MIVNVADGLRKRTAGYGRCQYQLPHDAAFDHIKHRELGALTADSELMVPTNWKTETFRLLTVPVAVTVPCCADGRDRHR